MTMPTPQEHRRAQALLKQISQLGFCMPGTLTERYTRCSSPGCRCRADPPALHGPYYSWTRKIAGKTATRALTAEQASRYQPWFDDARQLRTLAAELEALSFKLAQAAEGWGGDMTFEKCGTRVVGSADRRFLRDCQASREAVTPWVNRAITARPRRSPDALACSARLESHSFHRNGIGTRGRTAEHRLAGMSGTVALRHRTRDTDILGEMQWAYRPPASLSLPTSGIVLDIGANIGLFAIWTLVQRPGCCVVSYEPDPENLTLLARNHARADRGARWLIRSSAVGARTGEVRFASGGYADSRVNRAGDVVVPLVDIFEQAHAALMKIDIEGSEWDILRDRRQSALPTDTLVMEWHRHAPDGSQGDAAEAVQLLGEAGFAIAANDHDPGRDHGLIWATRP